MWNIIHAWAILCLCAARTVIAADCRTISVNSGDGCAQLATRCGISGDDFMKYNPQSGLCSSLKVQQRVCCSSGTLPDIRPKQNADGSCFSYKIVQNDSCDQIAGRNGLQTSDLSTFNDKVTWGWAGCARIMPDQLICLSTGKPPMPAPIANAVCGPIKPGSTAPASGQNLADMNPCKLNTCCDIWGQCGTTPEFCTAETGPTGNPGTAPVGKNGCISNCGTNIVNNAVAPSSYAKVGYYESWNWDRDCLNMRVKDFDSKDYTHVHWAFASFDSSNNVIFNDTAGQWADFVALTKPKRILSIGGWGISTDPSTYNLIRTAMLPANMQKTADNIVAFLNKWNLDGIDIDWEYPGAPDIKGIPPGQPSDGNNYLYFLYILKSKMPKGKTVSIAAPASYWYLQAFPIGAMSNYLDYIIYMTYDLHGQWDYDNKWTDEGCPGGNCLRNHVNMTETTYALAMITKAGVPAAKIMVGLSSYGRSFGMTNPACTGPMCTYGGPNSTATPGRCTNTAGYIADAEIQEILNNDPTAKTWYDGPSNADVMTYGGNQWVGYMSAKTKANRIAWWKAFNFGGTTDWAVDLQAFGNYDGDPDYGDDDDNDEWPMTDFQPCTASFSSLEDLGNAAGSFPDYCRGDYIANTMSTVLSGAVSSYNDLMANGYDKKFNTYANAVAQNALNSARDFVYNNGSKYFTCSVGELTLCCKQCATEGSQKDACLKYCFNEDSSHPCQKSCSTSTGSCKRDLEYANFTQIEPIHLFAREGGPGSVLVPNTILKKIAEPCPPDYSQRGYGSGENSVWWTLRSDMANQFWADIVAATGIPKEKFTFQDRPINGNACSDKTSDCAYLNWDFGIPLPNGYGVSDVTNPKTIIQKALTDGGNLQTQLNKMAIDLKAHTFQGDGLAFGDSSSVPVLMISDAVDKMKTIEDVADKIDAEKRKAIIIAFFSALLFFIPIAGELIGSVTGIAAIAGICTALGAAGGAALDIYTIIKDPANAPLAIFSLVLTPLGLTNIGNIAKAANIRRGMSDADIAKLGGKIAARMAGIKKLTGSCVKI